VNWVHYKAWKTDGRDRAQTRVGNRNKEPRDQPKTTLSWLKGRLSSPGHGNAQICLEGAAKGSITKGMH